MTRRIKLVSRSPNKETEVRRTRGAGPARPAGPPGLGEMTVPAIDISEKADEILVEMELPGVLERDIKILLYSNKVEISGFKRGLPRLAGAQYLRLEREFGAFRREVFVPRAIDPDRTFATLSNGVLTVVLKKHAKTSKDGAPRNRRGE